MVTYARGSRVTAKMCPIHATFQCMEALILFFRQFAAVYGRKPNETPEKNRLLRRNCSVGVRKLRFAQGRGKASDHSGGNTGSGISFLCAHGRPNQGRGQ